MEMNGLEGIKVRDLIEALNQFDPDYKVSVSGSPLRSIKRLTGTVNLHFADQSTGYVFKDRYAKSK